MKRKKNHNFYIYISLTFKKVINYNNFIMVYTSHFQEKVKDMAESPVISKYNTRNYIKRVVLNTCKKMFSV